VSVHGYGGTRSTRSPLQRRRSDAGCTSLHAITWTPFAPCVGTIARTLVRQCHDAMERAGADRVSLVGHGLGGVVVRHAVQELGPEPHVRTAVTVASPHRGTHARRSPTTPPLTGGGCFSAPSPTGPTAAAGTQELLEDVRAGGVSAT
jgi:pimeloyl-ACP methyl ester carboxylesterase